MRLEHWTIQYSQPSLHKEGGEERYFDLQRLGVQGKVTYGYLPVLLLHINKSLDLKQPHPDAPVPHFGCGMKDCWFVTHSSDLMWKHAASHGLTISEANRGGLQKK